MGHFSLKQRHPLAKETNRSLAHSDQLGSFRNFTLQPLRHSHSHIELALDAMECFVPSAQLRQLLLGKTGEFRGQFATIERTLIGFSRVLEFVDGLQGDANAN